MGVTAVAACWGLAEATVFFVVPDVYLTAVALRDRRAALHACLAAVAGALLGGALMFAWGARDDGAARALLDRVPAISPLMLARVEEEIAGGGPLALFVGPLRGTPYKTYAVLSGARARREASVGAGLAAFLAVSVPARLLRFALLASVAAWVARRPLAAWSLRAKRILHAALWSAFYAAYFCLMPS